MCSGISVCLPCPFFVASLFHPSPKFTPAVGHRLLPLPFGPLRVWIRGLRLSRYSTFFVLENLKIYLQFQGADNDMSFLFHLFATFQNPDVCVCCLLADDHFHQALLPQHSFTFQISLAPSDCDRLSILHFLCEWAL